jgi:energy-coupling factor transporter ATP-binding protein EcfA2
MGMILQDPKFSLNPVMTRRPADRRGLRIGDATLARARRPQQALERAGGGADPRPRARRELYPHELSGGMGQRVMIAMMVVREPDLLIADEPTSALDVTVRTQVLSILDESGHPRGMGLIFISHDLNLVSRFCDRVIVMYAGRIVETLRADLLRARSIPIRAGCSPACPRSTARSSRCPPSTATRAGWRATMIEVEHLTVKLRRLGGRGGCVSFKRRRGRKLRPRRRERLGQVDHPAHHGGLNRNWDGTHRHRRPLDARQTPQRDLSRRTCRWCSRTPTPRCTRATPSASRWPSRCDQRHADPDPRTANCWTLIGLCRASSSAFRTSCRAASASASPSPGRCR